MDFIIKEGITPSQIQELINFSNTDELILQTTRDIERFKDKSTFDKWLLKNRKVYTLVDTHDKLFGILWFGEKELPEDISINPKVDKSMLRFTWSIRIYNGARGKGLSKYFFENAFKMFKKTEEYQNSSAKGLWLITNSNNTPALKAYSKFGFVEISENDKNGKIIMALI